MIGLGFAVGCVFALLYIVIVVFTETRRPENDDE